MGKPVVARVCVHTPVGSELDEGPWMLKLLGQLPRATGLRLGVSASAVPTLTSA